jgi:hypothetical protein
MGGSLPGLSDPGTSGPLAPVALLSPGSRQQRHARAAVKKFGEAFKGPRGEEPPAAPARPKDISASQRRARERVRERAGQLPRRVTGPSGLTTTATTAPQQLLGI